MGKGGYAARQSGVAASLCRRTPSALRAAKASLRSLNLPGSGDDAISRLIAIMSPLPAAGLADAPNPRKSRVGLSL